MQVVVESSPRYRALPAARRHFGVDGGAIGNGMRLEMAGNLGIRKSKSRAVVSRFPGLRAAGTPCQSCPQICNHKHDPVHCVLHAAWTASPRRRPPCLSKAASLMMSKTVRGRSGDDWVITGLSRCCGQRFWRARPKAAWYRLRD